MALAGKAAVVLVVLVVVVPADNIKVLTRPTTCSERSNRCVCARSVGKKVCIGGGC